MAEFRINISNLSEGFHEYTFESDAQSIGLDWESATPVRVKAVVEKGRRQILLRAESRVTIRFTCDRCLDPFEKTLEANYVVVYAPDERSMIGVGKEGRKIQLLSADTNTIELDEDVRQYLLLDVPQKLLCSDTCEGLCPQCGARKNTTHCRCTNDENDPRWETLKKLTGN
jgi:uncharacterized protein